MMQQHSEPRQSGAELVLECLTQHVRCWRCWKVFHVFFEPYDFNPDSLLRCEKCTALRALNEGDFTSSFIRYVKRYALKTNAKFFDEALKKQFRKEFEERWAETCPCGGYFRCDIKPALQCPHCSAKSPRWIPWPIDPQLTPPLRVLKYSIPAAYLEYDPSLPAEEELSLRKSVHKRTEMVPPWIRHLGGALIVFFLYLTLPVVWLSKLFGLLTKEPRKPPK